MSGRGFDLHLSSVRPPRLDQSAVWIAQDWLSVLSHAARRASPAERGRGSRKRLIQMEKSHEKHENNGDRNEEDIPAGAVYRVDHFLSDLLNAMN